MIKLYGYQLSVYAWIARFALHVKEIEYDWIEVNPFAADVDPGYLAKNPFYRVPTLLHDDFTLYETGAITRYLDAAFGGTKLQPNDIKQSARMDQIISIIDSYAYWPLVRQVFVHGVMGPRLGRPFDPEEVKQGLEAAERALDAIELLVDGEGHLVGETLTLADIHFAPMVAYFCEAGEGEALLGQRKKLSTWFASIRLRDEFLATKPKLPDPVDC